MRINIYLDITANDSLSNCLDVHHEMWNMFILALSQQFLSSQIVEPQQSSNS